MWFKYVVSQQNSTEWSKILKQAEEGALKLHEMVTIFPRARFATTLRQFDHIENYGPKIAMLVRIEQFKSKPIMLSLLKYHQMVTPSGVEISVFGQSSGFDSSSLYTLYEHEWVRVENPENWYIGLGMNNEKILHFESGANLLGLIKYNVIDNAKSEVAWNKYTENPKIKFILDKIKRSNLSLDEGKKLLFPLLDSNDRQDFFRKYGTWWWRNAPQEEFIESLEKIRPELEKHNFVYDLSMDPHKEGKGKFINLEMIEQAFYRYGDFSVVGRYHSIGRIIYSSKEIVDFINNKDSDNDDAFEFFERFDNAGFRDFFIPL